MLKPKISLILPCHYNMQIVQKVSKNALDVAFLLQNDLITTIQGYKTVPSEKKTMYLGQYLT